MAKGDKLIGEIFHFKDAVTGRKMSRLTSLAHLSHHPYFYNRMFFKDGKRMICAIEIDDVRNFYILNMLDGSLTQLTEGEGILTYGPNISPDENYLFYCQGQSIKKLNLIDLSEELIYTTPLEWSPNDNPGISTDGRYILTAEMYQDDRLYGAGWSIFEDQWKKNPRCRLVYIEVETGQSHIVMEQNMWLGHPQIRPHHNDELYFCHEGPAHRVDARLWRIRSDGTQLQCVRPQARGEMISHEFWLADGSQLAYVYRKQNISDHSSSQLVDSDTYMPLQEYAKLKEYIMFNDPEADVEQLIMACSPYCHFIMDNTLTKIVGDGQTKETPYLYLVDVAKRSEIVLCEHGTSWKSYKTNQDSHPHPVFTLDGTKVVFTSDREGIPAIYTVEIYDVK